MMNNNINDSDMVCVVPNLAIECLIDKWYAWAHLVSPATAAMNIKNRHLKIMNSYIKNPKIHAAAVKNPKMLGGPFIDYDGKRVDEIEAMRDNTLEASAELLELSEAITTLNDILKTEAKGYSLNPIYPKIPDVLRGMVELFYDLNNNPSYRFFEPLLYKSKFYKDALQTINLFKVDDDDSRSFILSTPSLPNDQTIHLNIPFKDRAIDQLFEASRQPKKYGELKKLFNIPERQEPLFKSFFTKTVPEKYQKYTGEGALTRYFGHACVLIETKETSILVDPVISYGYDSDISRYTYSDLPDMIDYVLITHNHQDHVLLETLMRIRHKVRHLVVPKSNGGGLQDPSLKLMFEQIGFDNIIEIGDMETLEFADCSITGIPFLGEHSDLDVRSKICHLVKFENDFKMLFVADSCNIEPRLYERVHKIFGNVDVLFFGMECDGAPLTWLYGPLMSEELDRDQDQSRRLAGCNFDQGKALVDVFNPKNVFVYAMGMEPWLKYISSIKYTDESLPIIESNRILDYCQSEDIVVERLFGEKIIEYTNKLVTS